MLPDKVHLRHRRGGIGGEDVMGNRQRPFVYFWPDRLRHPFLSLHVCQSYPQKVWSIIPHWREVRVTCEHRRFASSRRSVLRLL